jgi:transposase
MLTVRPNVVVRLALDPIDFRNSIDGLAIAVGRALGRDPLGGEVFLFLNRRRTALRALYWTPNGFVLVYKRLERLTFALPRPAAGAAEIVLPATLLNDLLAGVTRDMRSHDLDGDNRDSAR